MALFLSTTVIAQSAEWEPVTGEENLRNFMSGTTLEWEEPGAGKAGVNTDLMAPVHFTGWML
jgi:hypothetical protein